ncbi:MAG: hypothetical protein K6E84_08435, partial [Lachnospiraceae bacterium]|nr:hypothetical protein [Lachnospiraceae bacterium]
PIETSSVTQFEGYPTSAKKETLKPNAILYIGKMRKLAEDNGAEFMLLLTPYYGPQGNLKQPYFNTLKEYAQQEGIALLNMNEVIDELELDESLDYAHGHHLSLSGARKTGAYLADYVHEHYDIEDHRGDERYQIWEENLREVKKIKVKQGVEDAEGADVDPDERTE